jgi:hypothetical protein
VRTFKKEKMSEGPRITPGSLQRSGQQPSRSSSKQALAGRSSSKTSVGPAAVREGPLRPPPGFVSYQIPNGALPPSDNIQMLDARRFMSVGSLMGSRPMAGHHHHHHHGHQQNGGHHTARYARQNSGGNGGDGHVVYITAREPPPATASVYPAHLHNGGGRSHGKGGGHNGAGYYSQQHWSSADGTYEEVYGGSGYYGQQHTKPQHHHHQSPDIIYQPPPWAGERLADQQPGPSRPAAVFTLDSPVASAPRRYPSSPIPGRQPAAATRSLQHPAKGLSPSEDPRRRPPLPGAQLPRPPPRSRPRSWTSTLFNAMRNGASLSKKNNATNSQSEEQKNNEEEQEETVEQDQQQQADEDRNNYYYYGGQYISSSTTPGALRDPTSYNTGTLEKRSKQVRFLANPSKPVGEAGLPRFYSLPRFILPSSSSGGELRERGGGRRPSQQMGAGGEAAAAKLKMRSRTPSPFGRFVKSLVRGKPAFPG